jgi:glycosyltransferase involved in cell wall biosynthesis
MRIAQVAPLYESVPPKTYGGTERIVSYLTEELVAQGHEVTLFATGDSQTRARLVAPCAEALRSVGCVDALPHHFAMLEEVYRRAAEFDIVHFHTDYLHFATTRRVRLPNVTTLHGRLDMPELGPLYDEFAELPLVSISKSQRQPLPDANWAATIHHGLPTNLHHRGPGGDYLAFVGRISPEKRVDRAIEIAERAGLRIKIAAKIDRADRAYHKMMIEHLFDKPHVEFLGELDEVSKGELLRNARALVFPIDWPEPFGLVMIEAMACGTPVIAFRAGSTPEVVDDGVTGFVVESIPEAVRAVARLDQLSRSAVRRTFEQRFSAARMAGDYVDIYEQLASDLERRRFGDVGLRHHRNRFANG